MEVKPGYRQTEVGVIPEDWTVKSIKQISDPVRGGSPRPAGDPRYFNGSYIPWLTVAALTNIPASQNMVIETGSLLTEEGSLHSRTLTSGTLIIANSGATLGVAKILGMKCCANDGIAALLNLSGDVCTLYLTYYINTHTKYLRDVVATGNGQPNLNTNLIGNFKFSLPPTKAEQEAIAEALSDADALIESLEQLIQKKRLIKQGAMQELLTRKKRLPGFSGEWEVKPLGDLFSFSGGYSASRDQLSSEGYCYLHYGDIHGASKMIIDTKDDYQNIPKLNIPLKRISSNFLLKDGDVVFVDASEDDGGTSKYIVVLNKDDIPFIAGLHTIVARSKTFELAHEYRCYCFQTADIHKQFLFFAVGTKVSGISKTNITKLMLPVPPYFEQIAMADILMNMDAEIEKLEVKLEKIRQLKQGVMHNLLTGKIRLV